MHCRVLMTLLASITVFGCADPVGEGMEKSDPDGLEIPTTVRGVAASIIAGAFVEGKQALAIKISAHDLEFASYQSRIRFDAGVLSLTEYRLPEAEFHVLNDEEANHGVLVAGGFAPEAFAGPVEIVLVFDATRPVLKGDLSVELDIVGTADGRELDRSELRIVETMAVRRELQP